MSGEEEMMWDGLRDRLDELFEAVGKLDQRLTDIESRLAALAEPRELANLKPANFGFPTSGLVVPVSDALFCSYCLEEPSLPGVDYCDSCGQIGWPR